MPSDLLIGLQASVTKAATFNGAAFTLPSGTPRRGLKCRVLTTAATSTTTNTATYTIDVSYDGGSTWRSDFTADPPLSLTTTGQTAEQYIPFDISPTSAANNPQVRLTITLAGAGTPSVTYQGDLLLARP